MTGWYAKPQTWRQSLEEPDFAAAHMKAPPVHLSLPKKHSILLVPRRDGMLQPHAPSMQALQQVREMEVHSLAAHTRAHPPGAAASEAVPLRTVHHGPTNGDLLRALDKLVPHILCTRMKRPQDNAALTVAKIRLSPP